MLIPRDPTKVQSEFTQATDGPWSLNAADRPVQEVDNRPFPDLILRSQFLELYGARSLSSEQRLMLAVLADAINIVQDVHASSNSRKRSSFNDAWDWIFTQGLSCPLSFDSVCDALGIDADSLRWRLQALTSGGLAGPRLMPIRLRLKEASRMQRLTLNRRRRRASPRPQAVNSAR
jgi:hypothetical protein